MTKNGNPGGCQVGQGRSNKGTIEPHHHADSWPASSEDTLGDYDLKKKDAIEALLATPARVRTLNVDSTAIPIQLDTSQAPRSHSASKGKSTEKNVDDRLQAAKNARKAQQQAASRRRAD